jgi:hypothetical protein
MSSFTLSFSCLFLRSCIRLLVVAIHCAKRVHVTALPSDPVTCCQSGCDSNYNPIRLNGIIGEEEFWQSIVAISVMRARKSSRTKRTSARESMKYSSRSLVVGRWRLKNTVSRQKEICIIRISLCPLFFQLLIDIGSSMGVGAEHVRNPSDQPRNDPSSHPDET